MKTVYKDTEQIIRKWYQALSFSGHYDAEFEDALKNIQISDSVTADTVDIDCTDGKKNFLTFLYLCEALEEKYRNSGISHEILMDTLTDLVRWTNTWSGIHKTLYLGELSWLKRHLSGVLFRLGRLQFCTGACEHDIPRLNVKQGDNILEIHIPPSEDLNLEDCRASVVRAKQFYKQYFPEYEYKCFTCHSWLLDDTLKQILRQDSNILKFQTMFEPVFEGESDAILRYVFAWNATREKLSEYEAKSSLAAGIKKYIEEGRSFHETFAFLKPDNE